MPTRRFARQRVLRRISFRTIRRCRTGHSIGLEVHEAGDVSAVNQAIIRPGQCFSVEPGIYIPEENIGVRIEDLVLVTEDGCEVLNRYPKDLQVIPFPER